MTFMSRVLNFQGEFSCGSPLALCLTLSLATKYAMADEVALFDTKKKK